MIHQADFTAVGGFDERFFLYYEDADLCRRAQRAGLSIDKSHQAVFDHRGGLSHSSHADQKQAYFRSQDLYIGTYYGQGWVRLLKLLRVLRSSFFFSV